MTQMAKIAGATVFATVSIPEKAKLARDAGADEVILYTQSKFDDEILRMTKGAKLDVVYDGVGQSTFEQSLKCLHPRGLLALYGASSGPVPPFDLSRFAAMGFLYITRPISTDYVRTREQLTSVVEPVLEMYRSGGLKLIVRPPYTLEEVGKAHVELESRRSTGRLLLSICG
jgi:NADPH:quinone reductase